MPVVSIKIAICKFCRPIACSRRSSKKTSATRLTLQRLYSVILDSVQVSDAEVRERYRLDQEKINLNFVKFTVSDFIVRGQTHRRRHQEILRSQQRIFERTAQECKSSISTYPFDQFTASCPGERQGDRGVLPKPIREPNFTSPKRGKDSLHPTRRRARPPDAEAKESRRWRAPTRSSKKRAPAKTSLSSPKKHRTIRPRPKAAMSAGSSKASCRHDVDKLDFRLAKGEVSDRCRTAQRFADLQDRRRAATKKP